MGDVVRFTGITRLNMDPDQVLEAVLGKLDGVVIAGYDKDGNEYFASSYADGGDVLWLLERMKHQLMRISVEEDQ